MVIATGTYLGTGWADVSDSAAWHDVGRGTSSDGPEEELEQSFKQESFLPDEQKLL